MTIDQARFCFLLSFIALVTALFPANIHARSIRTVTTSAGQIVTVNTALGYSTILEFNSKPISAVLGDQDAFKLEYVGNSITIKPLTTHAKSNLNAYSFDTSE